MMSRDEMSYLEDIGEGVDEAVKKQLVPLLKDAE